MSGPRTRRRPPAIDGGGRDQTDGDADRPPILAAPPVQRAVITIGGEPEAAEDEDDDRQAAARPAGERADRASDARAARRRGEQPACRTRASGACLEASVRHVFFSVQPADLKDSPSAKAVAERHEAWKADLPKDEAALWDWLAAPRRGPAAAHAPGALRLVRRQRALREGRSLWRSWRLGSWRPAPSRPGRPARARCRFVDLFLEAHAKPPRQIILDLDATDDPLHGHQEGRFFHGYYDCYCYLPLYVFCGRHLLAAKLRPSNIDGSAGAVEEIARIVAQIRARWPRTRILLRADSGFAREALMAWCEDNRVDFVFGLARNARLVEEIAVELLEAEAEASSTGKPARRYKDFRYATLDSWSRRRRVIGKAEWTKGEANPRFIVTSLSQAETNGPFLYEKVYCARGEMENRIKECQGDLFADRTSTATMRANQLRLWFASFAYVLICALRRIGLAHTQFAEATCGTIRLKLLKLAGLFRISARRIKFALASACPYADEWRLAAARLA
jgi:hypothetical protein